MSAVRWAETQAVAEALGLTSFDEDDLYAALDWLEQHQPRIERALAPRNASGAFFLYDVSSSYLEGQKNELAAPGYNRDGKRFKKQIVMGLLTDVEGEPVSIQVYPGNTSDPTTVGDQVRKLAKDFEASEVVLVGDRGMLKAEGRQLLSEQSFRFVTALADPQVRKLLSEGTLQLELFSEKVSEVVAPEVLRYVLRRNPATKERHRTRRADQLERVRQKVENRNTLLKTSKRASAEASLRKAEHWLEAYKLKSYVTARLDGSRVVLEVDEDCQRETELLDGCYVIISDVPREKVTAQQLWERYGDLQRVERDFRTLKTGMLEIRPLFLRKASRTRGHALVSMLALKLVRALTRRIQPLGLTVQDALARLDGVRLVTLADPKLGLWRLPSRWDEPQRQVLSVLPPLPPPMLSLRPEALVQENPQ
jgi:transposase